MGEIKKECIIMGTIRITQADSFFFERQKLPLPHFTAEDYLARLDLLTGRMREKGVSHVVIYGDREHFSNIEYFSSYDCRFEEALLIVDSEGGRWIIVGNEGMGYSHQIPYPINRISTSASRDSPATAAPRLKNCWNRQVSGREAALGW